MTKNDQGAEVSDSQILPSPEGTREEDIPDPWKKLIDQAPEPISPLSVEPITPESVAALEQNRISDALMGTAIVLGLLFLTQVGLTAFPITLNDPGQLLTVISELISLSPLLLLSTLLFFLRASRNPLPQPYGESPQADPSWLSSAIRGPLRVAGVLYLLLIPLIVFSSMDLRTLGLKNLEAMRYAQSHYITRASLQLTSEKETPMSVDSARQQLRDYMLRFDINTPGVELKHQSRDQLLNLMREFQDQATEQYLNKRFIADNDLMRRSLRNIIGATLYGSIMLYLTYLWPKGSGSHI